MIEFSHIPIRIATAILLKNGEISLAEIEGIPFVEDEEYAVANARYLVETFDVVYAERIDEEAELDFEIEEVIRLVKPVQFKPEKHLATSASLY